MSDKAEPINEAVAIQYDGDGAPRVTAKGRGEIAEKIIALAQENDIPLYQDAKLTGLLSQLELQDTIPEELYLAVAKVLAFIYSLKD